MVKSVSIFVVLLIAISFVAPVQVFAQSSGLLPFTQYDLEQIDQKESLRDTNEIKLPANCGTSSSGVAVDPGENAETVWRFFADKLPGHQIAGIIGNMTAESGVQPQRLQGTSSGTVTPASEAVKFSGQTAKAWGLVQWDPNGKMISTFSDPTEADNITNQLTFLWSQLNGGTSSPEGPAGNDLRATSTIAEAAEVFARKYERPAAEALAESLSFRIGAAEAAYERFNDKIETVETPVGEVSDGSTTYQSACDDSDKVLAVQAVQRELEKGAMEFDENVLVYTDGNMEPWAASFVSWVFKESGNSFSGGFSGGWRRPSVNDLQEMFKNEAGFEYFEAGSKEPRAGDVAFYAGAQSPGESGGGVVHVNIVTEVNSDGTMTTVGGNENNRVMQSTRSTTAGEQGLVGFGRRL